MTNYTHPGQHMTVTFGPDTVVAYDWQGNALFTCCRGRAACGRHVNYVPKVDQPARIANGPAVWQVEAVDEHERTVDLWTIHDNGITYRRVIGFENLTIVSAERYAQDMGAANIRRSQLGTGWDPHDPPVVGKCSGCQRCTWSSDEIGSACSMTQPDGSRCSGTFQR